MSVLRVLWMSTHVALLFFFPLHPHDNSVDGAQEPDAAPADYYQESPGGTYYWIEPADQE